jgi:ketosteroid isomerase-like protein
MEPGCVRRLRHRDLQRPLRGKVQGNPVARDRQGTLVFVKVGGDWKVVHEHFSPLGAPAAPKS